MTYHEILKKYWGYDDFRGIQREIIESIGEGRDTLGLMPTGGGKSITFQVPALAVDGVCIVVTPLIALMKDQVANLRSRGIRAVAVYSGMKTSDVITALENCIFGGYKFLYISPERLTSELFLAKIKKVKVSLITVDEAHCISQWGHDFRPAYRQIGLLREMFPGVPVLALTATATPAVVKDIQQQLRFAAENCHSMSFERKNLVYVVRNTENKQQELLHILNRMPGSAIVYTLNRKKTKEVCDFLTAHGITAEYYHAGLAPESKDAKEEAWKSGKARVMVSTNAFGMGIDKSNVRYIVHYNLPKSIESFYQEIGRAGRDGLPSETVMFFNVQDLIVLRNFAEESGQKDINNERLNRMQEYAEARVCRRRILLNYFGEISDRACCNCDVCHTPPQYFDGTILVQQALSAIKRCNENIGIFMLIDILKGVVSEEAQKRGYTQIKTFGVGRNVPARDWKDYILQMLQMGFIEIAYNENRHLRITPLGEDILFSRRTAELATIVREEPAKKKRKAIKETPDAPKKAEAGTLDSILLELLRIQRKRIATENNWPAYVVLSDKTLHELATKKPVTLEAFSDIHGIGKHKLEMYGETFISIIKDYLSK